MSTSPRHCSLPAHVWLPPPAERNGMDVTPVSHHRGGLLGSVQVAQSDKWGQELSVEKRQGSFPEKKYFIEAMDART